MLPGSGIDLARFAPTPYPAADQAPVFLLIARLLRDKGVVEYVEAARRVKEGRFDGTPIRYGLESGVVSFVWNPALLGRVPAPVVDEVDRAKEKIVSGEIVVPRGNF